MREDVFSAVGVLRRNVFGTKHVLLKADPQGGGQPQYLWLILGEVMDGKKELNNTEVQITQDELEKIAAYGTLSTLKFLGSRESGTGRPAQDVGWQ